MSKIFVTVGTTSFDDILLVLLEKDVTNMLKSLGYKHMTLQVGNTKLALDQIIHNSDFSISSYKFKDSIQDDIRDADFVISHAGAGSCIEILNAGKPLLVVVNEKLMGNHQWELAKALEKNGCLHYCTCSNLKEALRKDFKSLKPPPEQNTKAFTNYIDTLMGY